MVGFNDIFSNLEELQILDAGIFSAILKNAEHADVLTFLICIYKNRIKDREFYQNLCENINHIGLIIHCWQKANDTNVPMIRPFISKKRFLVELNESQFEHPFTSFIFTCCNNAKYAKQIEQISSIFSHLMTDPKCLSLSQDILCRDINKMISDLSDFNLNEKNSIIRLTISSACHNGHLHVVELLLNDLRIVLEENNNNKLFEEFFKGFNSCHREVVELLLNDERLNPIPQHKEAILLYFSNINNEKSSHLISVFSAFLELEKRGLLSEISIKAICLHPAKIPFITKAFSYFHKIGYSNNHLLDVIFENANYIDECISLFKYLKSIGIPLGEAKDTIMNRNAILKRNRHADVSLKYIFQLIEKTNLFKPQKYYNVVLMNTLPTDQKCQNIIIITQFPIGLYQFDENGNRKEISSSNDLQQRFNAKKLSHLFSKKLEANNPFEFNDSLDFTELSLLYKLL